MYCLWTDSISIFILLVQLTISKKITNDDDLVLITLSTGQIRGRNVITERNVSGYQFLGIPYAEPPVGDLRYRNPLPIRKWKNVINTTEYKQSCLWNSSETSNDPNKTPMSEDCLFNNVLTNQKCLKSGGCAVIVYIHGGGFRYDTPSLFSPEFLIDNFLTNERSVVFVMPSYRLASYGFLNLSPNITSTAVKNIGLKDLIEALQWVQREIEQFGGNKSNVAIMGHSSGGITVNYLTMSPLTRGLFSKAIMMSGGGTLPIPYDNNHLASVQLAVAAGCANYETNFMNTYEVELVLKCLREVDARQLNILQRHLEDHGFIFTGPCIDPPDGVLPEPIKKLRRKRDSIRFMAGCTTQEFSSGAFLVNADGTIDKRQLWKACDEAVTKMAFRNKMRTIVDCFIEYLNPSRASHLFDDISIFLPTALSSDDINQAGGVSFLYEFQYPYIFGAYNSSQSFLGASPHHTEDLVYIMGIHKGVFTEKDEIIRQKYSQLFVNFANNGDPSVKGEPKWESYTAKRNNYFAIDFDRNNRMPGMKNGYHRRAIKLWNDTALKHSHGTFDWISEKTLLPFTMETDDNPTISFAQSIPGGDNVLDQLAEIANGNLQVIQDVLPFVLMDTNAVETPTTTTQSDEGNWDTYFWISVLVIVMLAIALLITCALFCYNCQKRREYERII